MSVVPCISDFWESTAKELKNANKNGAATGHEHNPNDNGFLVRSLDVAGDYIVAWFSVALVGLGHHHFPGVDLEVVGEEKSFDESSEEYLNT